MKSTSLALLLAGTALCHPAWAQDEPFDLGAIRIGAPDAQSLLGNDRIDAEEIENRNASSTKDIFAGESSITASGGAAIGQKVFVNGIEESLLSVTIDGARQNKSAFHHTGNVLLDPELLKSVDVSRGLAPADAGPNALAGSIAYETKDVADLLEPGDNFGGYTRLSYSSSGDEANATLAIFGRSGGFEYLLAGTRRDGDDYKDGAGVRITGTGADLTDYMAKFAFDDGSGPRLEFTASRTEDTGKRAAQPGPGGILFTRPDFFGVVGATSVLTDALARRTSYTLTYTNDQMEGIWDPTIQLSYNEQEIDASGVEGTNKSFSGTFKNDFQLANGVLTAGLDFFNERAKGQGNGPGPFGSSGEEKLRNIGVFAQIRQDIGDRLSLSYGARYDWQNFEAANGQDFDSSGLSANASLDFVLSDAWTLNAGLASSWGGYELGEAALINFFTPWTYNGFTTSRANAARIGLRYAQGPWKGSFALFRTEVDDINAVLPSGGNRGASADLTSQGFDASLSYEWASGFAAMNWTYADVELNDSAIGSTAYYLGRPLGHIIGLEAGWDVSDEWRIGGTAQIALKNEDAAVTLPGYEVVNLYATYKPRRMENLEVRFDVRNLFDETYSARSNDGIDRASVIPLTDPGRSIGITARIRF